MKRNLGDEVLHFSFFFSSPPPFLPSESTDRRAPSGY